MLHIRWWHAQSHDMVRILRHAGIETRITDMVPPIVDTCRACRAWARPEPRNMASMRLATRFNEYVQVDLLFVGDLIVCHLIDEATRFSGGGICKDRSTEQVLQVIYLNWLAVHGAPGHLIADQEGALEADEARIMCDRHNIERRPKPVGTKAAIVERHHEVIRNTIRRTKSQLEEEGLNAPMWHLVAEAFHAHANAHANANAAGPMSVGVPNP